MITQKKVVEAVNEFNRISNHTIRKYIYELMELLDDRELLTIIMNNVKDFGIRKKAYEILQKRIKQVNNNGLEHDYAVKH